MVTDRQTNKQTDYCNSAAYAQRVNEDTESLDIYTCTWHFILVHDDYWRLALINSIWHKLPIINLYLCAVMLSKLQKQDNRVLLIDRGMLRGFVWYLTLYYVCLDQENEDITHKNPRKHQQG